MDEIPQKILSFLLNPEFTGILSTIRTVFIIISAILFAGIIIFLIRTSWLRHRIVENLTEFISYKPLEKGKLLKRWNAIEKKIASGTEDDYKLAIIEADNLLDEFLEKMDLKGESIEDRLKQVDPITIKNIDEVWEAHKIRNNVVHDPDYGLTLDQAKQALGIYRKALEHLGFF